MSDAEKQEGLEIPVAANGKGQTPFRWSLVLGALGVVFGDIGTSPLYAVKECFHSQFGAGPSTENVLGVLSLVFWSLVLLVTVKYLFMVLYADNDGEGGILALLMRVMSGHADGGKRFLNRKVALILGMCGASLLIADGMITPAISVLSAVEGMEVATPVLRPCVVPVTVVVLVVLFLAQKHGTSRIGWVFGPVMLIWFVAIAVLGISWIVRQPGVLNAINPAHAVWFVTHNGGQGLLVFGAVILCLTGCEALYADMGHFGRLSLSRAWHLVVFPGIILNYFGQGACVLALGPAAARNPFYSLAPAGLLFPMVILATVATVIASQALISGMFSMARQAILLDFCPRMNIVHTSSAIEGQIYVPGINAILMIACVGLVLGFRSSSGLAGAYGMAVIGTMLITTTLLSVVQREQWKWPIWRVVLVSGSILLIEIMFLAGNVPKIAHGAWFTLVSGVLIFIVLNTWRRGKMYFSRTIRPDALTLEDCLAQLAREKIHRIPGTALFMIHPRSAPRVLLHHVKHNKVLHEHVILMSVITEEVPVVPESKQVTVQEYEGGFIRITARCGFMQSVNVPRMLRLSEASGFKLPSGEISYYIGRVTLRTTGHSKMWRWQKALFAFLFHNERSPADHFGLPPNRVIELGEQSEL